MRILVLASDIPATTNMPGSPRLFSLCRELSKTHEIYLATLCQSIERYRWFLNDFAADGVFKQVIILPNPPSPTWWHRQVHRFHLGAYCATNYLHPEYFQQVRKMVQDILLKEAISVVYVDSLAMAQYVETSRQIPAIVDLHDSQTLWFTRMMKLEKQFKRKLLLYLQAKSIARWEKSLSKSFPLIITNSKVDEMFIKQLSPSANTLTISNGVDSTFFTPTGGMAAPEKLVFTGVMSYGPNEDAATYFSDAIFPLIRERYPKAEFWAVGNDPTPRIQLLSQHPGVHVTGGVADIRPYLQSAGIFVCPLRYGSGIKNKILAALAMQKPVVATRISIDGLDLKESHDLLIADDPKDFADKVVRLLEDPGYAQCLGQNGQSYVRRRHSWEASANLLNDALLGLVLRSQSRTVESRVPAGQVLAI